MDIEWADNSIVLLINQKDYELFIDVFFNLTGIQRKYKMVQPYSRKDYGFFNEVQKSWVGGLSR